MSGSFCSFSNKPCVPRIKTNPWRWPVREEIVQNSRILIIDDRAENVLLLERMLAEAGYQHLRSITDSRLALTALADFAPDLVAIDLRMPYIDGFTLLKQLRSRIPE